MVLIFSRNLATAQGTAIDPTFLPAVVYKPASLEQAIQQADGKRVLLGDMVRASGSSATSLVRLLANSTQPDPVFRANVQGLQGRVLFIKLLANDKFLLVSDGALTLGNVTRQHLLRLNSDGTPDAGFDAGTGASVVNGFYRANIAYAVGQPDGKLLVTGLFTRFNGQTVGGLVRLNVDGSLDTSFQQALGSGLDGNGQAVALQADGKIVVVGYFEYVSGISRISAVRLMPSGAIDSSFVVPIPGVANFNGVAIQPDGKLLITGGLGSTWPTLVRLETTGAVDASFQTGSGFQTVTGSRYCPTVIPQPDGKLLVRTYSSTYNGTPVGRLVRLLPTGALDPSFNNLTTVPARDALTSVQLLPNGQLLVTTAGTTHYAPAGSLTTGIALLNADGTHDTSFLPLLQAPGLVQDIVRQPDGKYIIGGHFTEFNGATVGNLARLNADGSLDASFIATASDEVNCLLRQPDGKLLVGGWFTQIAGNARQGLVRLLPTGALDTSFAPPFIASEFTHIDKVALLNDGRIITAGTKALVGATQNTSSNLFCFDAATGQVDPTFPTSYYAYDMLVQPDGNIVIAGQTTINAIPRFLFRLLPSGAIDPAFVLTSGASTALELARDASGRLYVFGTFVSFGGSPVTNVARLLSTGSRDPSFAAVTQIPYIYDIAAQPNGRLLLGISSTSTGTLRLLPTGVPDASYAATAGPATSVRHLLIQPDGAIMAVGDFTSVGGQAISGVVRLLDANVLSVSNQKLATLTQAWPVPAHSQLHLKLDAASRPQRVELLDALGRVVLAQSVAQPELTFDTTPLRAGAYVLRVQYASGPVTRRVAVE
ncbi:hypothetical protein GCM10027345_39460 [Hymenobacter daeguensis]